MKLKILILSLLPCLGIVQARQLPLSSLTDTFGTVIGSNANTATTTAILDTYSLGKAAVYADFASFDAGKWYVNNNKNTNLGGYGANAAGVLLAMGGPHTYGTSAIGAVKFSLTAAQLAGCTGSLTMSFNIMMIGGNANQNHQIAFSLVGADETATSATFNTKTGSPILPTTPTKVTLTLSAEAVQRMVQAKTDIALMFLAQSSATYGGNRGVLMNDFAMEGDGFNSIPEPATASLSLLGLGLLLVRRRR